MATRQSPGTPPLRPHVLHILLALAETDRHGLGIADAVERSSEGLIELGPGTLYRTLSELVEAGLIRAIAAPIRDADPRRKYYRISAPGRRLLAAEVERLKRLVGEADRGLAPESA